MPRATTDAIRRMSVRRSGVILVNPLTLQQSTVFVPITNQNRALRAIVVFIGIRVETLSPSDCAAARAARAERCDRALYRSPVAAAVLEFQGADVVADAVSGCS